jgi:LysM repeat protein
MRKFLLTTTVILCSFFAFAQKGLIATSGEKGLFIAHKVAAKESFYSIGRAYGVHPQEIANYNQLDMTKGLAIGQTVKIPLASNFNQSDDKGTPVYYVVGEKEGLYRVSVKSGGVLMANLRKWNKLTSDNIKPGQKLIVGFIIPTDQVAAKPSAPTGDPANEKLDEKLDIISEVKVEGVKEEKKVDIQEIKQDEVINPIPKPVQANRAATNDGTGGYFRTSFEQQARAMSINKEQTATAGIFKTSSGWEDSKYYILIDKVEPGTIVKVTNPSNNKVVYAKVLEGMSGIRQNAGLDVRISNAAASILDVTQTDKFILKVAY